MLSVCRQLVGRGNQYQRSSNKSCYSHVKILIYVKGLFHPNLIFLLKNYLFLLFRSMEIFLFQQIVCKLYNMLYKQSSYNLYYEQIYYYQYYQYERKKGQNASSCPSLQKIQIQLTIHFDWKMPANKKWNSSLFAQRFTQ